MRRKKPQFHKLHRLGPLRNSSCWPTLLGNRKSTWLRSCTSWSKLFNGCKSPYSSRLAWPEHLRSHWMPWPHSAFFRQRNHFFENFISVGPAFALDLKGLSTCLGWQRHYKGSRRGTKATTRTRTTMIFYLAELGSKISRNLSSRNKVGGQK